MKISRWSALLGALGLILLLVGASMGLFLAPAEQHMGDVSRILYVHVPTAWNGLLVYLFAFVFALLSLWHDRERWDGPLTGAVETGVVLNVVLLLTGMFFARPTWGVWWDWDVRLTTSLVSLFLFAGVLALRSFLDDAEQRATWSAVATIIAFVDVPLIYFCVRWWRSLHQIQSSPDTVDSAMVLPLRINAFAILFLAIWMITVRSQIEKARLAGEQVPEPKRLAPLVEGAVH